MSQTKIAIVYDWIDKWGGVERVLLALHELFPSAPFYTSYYDHQKAKWAQDFDIKTSFIQRLPRFIQSSRVLSLPLYPYAFESFNFERYDLVISVTSSFAKGVITRPETKHICYLLTPTRFLWSHSGDYGKLGRLGILGRLGEGYKKKMREWDYVAAQRPDKIISISQTVAERCTHYYRRDSEVIYPPFDEQYWLTVNSKVKEQGFDSEWKDKDYFLIVSRLEKYKKVDLVIKTFEKFVDKHLIIVGSGSEEQKLKNNSPQNVTFLHHVSDEELISLYSHAQALIMPQEEDFGYVSVESQFLGTPVIAYRKGGATETVTEGETGVFFDEQSTESLGGALERFAAISYNLRTKSKEEGPKNVQKYSKEKFRERFLKACNI